MASEHHFILELTTVLGASAFGGYIANRLRQPVLLGYLASGLIVGPFGLQLVSDTAQINALAEIGVAFLLFALGVEFSLAELKRVKEIALQGSLMQIGLTVTLGALISLAFGWAGHITQGVFLGEILSLSSTAVVLKTLTERGETSTLHGQVMLAILIVQDLVLGLMLALLPALDAPENLVSALLAAVLKAVLFFTAAFAVGRWLVPHLIRYVAATESSELFLLTAIALCLGVALTTAALGLSIEMGAFVAGLMLAELDYADRALSKVLPLRDTFASLFFASIGMLVDPAVLWDNLGSILALVLLVMVGKAAIVLPIVLRFRYSFKTAVIAAFGLNQIGEFSFVLALEGKEFGLLNAEQYLLLLGTTAITLVLTPIGMRWSPRIADRLAKIPLFSLFLQRFGSDRQFFTPETIRDHVVVAGYGRVGQVLVKILRERGYQVLVIENSEAAIVKLRSQKIPYIFGDAESGFILEKAHLEKAKALAIALPDPASTRLLLKRALEFAPELDIVVRCHSNQEIDLLSQLGAKEVVQPEFEAALEMGGHMLTTLGENMSSIQLSIRKIRTDRYQSIRSDVRPVSERDIDTATEQLHNEWVTIPEASPLHWMTLATADLRNLTGVTVMAIEQGDDMFYYPKGQTTLRTGDRLLVVGKPEEVLAFYEVLEGRRSIDGGYNHWVTLTDTSPLVGMTPNGIYNDYQTQVKAVRRHGKLYSVDDDIELESGDCCLLSGDPERAEYVAELAMRG
ncbi:cation:proton antiporter domain-containing protein [Baaleninema simplex]|uniref:cation:proton antiporter domain-containing protein n=1 Tax=Baaleninema simplex TaxID=2862350 RepID=UPI00034A52F2|nr:cation:proton antiporter [Baaleninema simplex]